MILCFLRFLRTGHHRTHHHKTSRKSGTSDDGHGGGLNRTAKMTTLFRVSFGCFCFNARPPPFLVLKNHKKLFNTEENILKHLKNCIVTTVKWCLKGGAIGNEG